MDNEQIEYRAVADLVQEVLPYSGQDCELYYRVRTDNTMDTDATITGWALNWALFTSPDAASATLVKTTAAGTITIATPYATVVLTAANLSALTVGTQYYMQLRRVDSGNSYPLTGIGSFVVQQAPPLA